MGIKIGLALGSGSARGWAHIGIIKALIQRDINPDIVCGTSIGALVGAAYCAGKLDDLQTWVSTLSKYEMARFFEINATMNGFVDVDKLFGFFQKYVADKEQKIEDMKITFACVATQLHSGREEWFTKGNVLQALQASVALPGLFTPVIKDEKWLVDGGLVNPVPVSLCRALGADMVIAVNLNGDLVSTVNEDTIEELENQSQNDNRLKSLLNEYTPDFLKKNTNTPTLYTTIASSINIVQDRITKSRLAGDPADVLLHPRLNGLGLLEFYKAKETIQEGFDCVERMQSNIDYSLGKQK
jgi:NTE family protein